MVVYTPLAIKEWNTKSSTNEGIWKPARPLENKNVGSILKRITAAYKVLIGKYDALDWEGH